MSVLGAGEAFMLASGEPTPTKIQHSLRFSDDDGAFLNKACPGSNRKTWTWSAWVKRSGFATQILFIAKGASGPNPHNGVWFEGDRLVIQSYPNNFSVIPNKEIRDPSAWYHFCRGIRYHDCISCVRQDQDLDKWGTSNCVSWHTQLPQSKF